MVKAGAANFQMNFTAKTALERVVTYVGDCDEVDRYLRLPEFPLQTPFGERSRHSTLVEITYQRISKPFEDGSAIFGRSSLFCFS